MRVLLLLSGGIHQAWVRRRVLRLEFLHRLEIRRVGNDFRKLLQLIELTQFCSGLLLFNNSSAHDKSSVCGSLKTYAAKERSTTTNSTRSRRLPTRSKTFAASRRTSKRLSLLIIRGHSRRRVSRPPRTEHGTNQIISKLPHRPGELSTLRQHVVERVDEHVHFALADD